VRREGGPERRVRWKVFSAIVPREEVRVATERLSMRKTKEILRQKWVLGSSHRVIGKSVGVSPGAVSGVVHRAAAAGLAAWVDVEPLGEDELEARLFPSAIVPMSTRAAEPDCEWIHRERRRKGVTLELLHQEFLEEQPSGLRYTAFCERYRTWLGKRGLVMRHDHVAGDKMLVDYSGAKPRIFDRSIGEMVEVELFVAVLGASNLSFAEVTRTQSGPDWIASHVHALEYFGGVPRGIVCDQLKTGVTRACRYEPEVQRTYEDLAVHYGTSVLPARPYRPRDKAKVEVCVQIVQRWILARLRNEVFHSIAEMNARILELLVDVNERRVMRRFGRTRRQMFEELERGALAPLPTTRFEYAEWKKARVNIDYHVAFDEHFYSVPYAHVHAEVWVRATGATVEVFLRGRRVATHPRSRRRGKHTTTTEHMPSAHRAHAEWTPSRILSWAESCGPSVRALCEAILRDRPHPEQGFRSCLGILRLEKRYGRERLEVAATRALRVGARSYRHVDSMLKHGLDRVPEQDDSHGAAPAPIDHENLRGRDYYLN
jgi:transposase